METLIECYVDSLIESVSVRVTNQKKLYNLSVYPLNFFLDKSVKRTNYQIFIIRYEMIYCNTFQIFLDIR